MYYQVIADIDAISSFVVLYEGLIFRLGQEWILPASSRFASV